MRQIKRPITIFHALIINEFPTTRQVLQAHPVPWNFKYPGQDPIYDTPLRQGIWLYRIKTIRDEDGHITDLIAAAIKEIELPNIIEWWNMGLL